MVPAASWTSAGPGTGQAGREPALVPVRTSAILELLQNGIDMGALLKSTCNTFLKTLEECMQIANVAFSSELLHRTPSGSPHLAVLKLNKADGIEQCENGSVKAETNHCEQTPISTLIPSHLKSNEEDCDISAEDHVEKKLTGDEVKDDGESKVLPIEGNSANESLQLAMDSISGPAPSHCGEGKEEDLSTFFSVMNIRFSDIELQEGDGIPTEEFLQSCYAIVPVLDKLGPTVFAPVKMDFVDNAYGKTLRQHHGWVVRGVFALALRAAPTYEDFVAALSVKKCDNQEEAFYNAMQRDLHIYLPAMEKQLNILDTLYEVHGLESDEVV
ncbi:Pleckstrin like proteiny domain-containing family A member 8 [Chelonia mydas]|uniref:Pleckstrin like proteiny domain-containing family A member 8 n=1 Tax=Chelonia mydas TaxID=8469 RepID=M7BXP0_CHEMY|nr:Pleckstrin like proteiny domain-containing family A member 8 [Chelonia mydas]